MPVDLHVRISNVNCVRVSAWTVLCASAKVLAVCCYTCCVITSLSTSQFYRDEVKKVMPSTSFSEMIKILENFLSFLDFAVS